MDAILSTAQAVLAWLGLDPAQAAGLIVVYVVAPIAAYAWVDYPDLANGSKRAMLNGCLVTWAIAFIGGSLFTHWDFLLLMKSSIFSAVLFVPFKRFAIRGVFKKYCPTLWDIVKPKRVEWTEEQRREFKDADPNDTWNGK